jgi:hypothetical protein
MSRVSHRRRITVISIIGALVAGLGWPKRHLNLNFADRALENVPPSVVANAEREEPDLQLITSVPMPARLRCRPGRMTPSPAPARCTMPLPQVLPRLAAALRPGGVLVAVAHHRVEFPRDLLAHALSTLAVYGRQMILIWIPRARGTGGSWTRPGCRSRLPG